MTRCTRMCSGSATAPPPGAIGPRRCSCEYSCAAAAASGPHKPPSVQLLRPLQRPLARPPALRSALAVLGLGWPVLGLTVWAALCCCYFHFLEASGRRGQCAAADSSGRGCSSPMDGSAAPDAVLPTWCAELWVGFCLGALSSWRITAPWRSGIPSSTAWSVILTLCRGLPFIGAAAAAPPRWADCSSCGRLPPPPGMACGAPERVNRAARACCHRAKRCCAAALRAVVRVACCGGRGAQSSGWVFASAP
jgi:hypothetical protein